MLLWTQVHKYLFETLLSNLLGIYSAILGSYINSIFYFFHIFFIVVQLELTPLFSHYSPLPCPSLSGYLRSCCLSLMSYRFITVVLVWVSLSYLVMFPQFDLLCLGGFDQFWMILSHYLLDHHLFFVVSITLFWNWPYDSYSICLIQFRLLTKYYRLGDNKH